MLHITDMVANSEMADVVINGKKMRGIVMEEAKGENSHVVADKAYAEGKKPQTKFISTDKQWKQLMGICEKSVQNEHEERGEKEEA